MTVVGTTCYLSIVPYDYDDLRGDDNSFLRAVTSQFSKMSDVFAKVSDGWIDG
jgi:hypothetical protein